MTTIEVWRHPRPEGAAGLCVGAATDLPVNRRRAKRLARRIQRFARRHRLPHAACCSPLARSAEVGRWLRRWGWHVHIEAALRELDFGAWDGRRWDAIARAEVDAWVANFADHAPGGDGETLRALLARAAGWAPPAGVHIAIGHGGWMLARRWVAEQGQALPSAAQWPRPPACGERWTL